jgi:hypothetical protein
MPSTRVMANHPSYNMRSDAAILNIESHSTLISSKLVEAIKTGCDRGKKGQGG